MRTVKTKQITENIREMCIEANHFLTGDMTEALDRARESEKAPLGKQILQQLQENLQIAGEDMIPICQDTGMAVVFAEVGQDVHIEGGLLEDAIQEGVRRGYTEGFLRKSVVKDPLIRENTSQYQYWLFQACILDQYRLVQCGNGISPDVIHRLQKFCNLDSPVPITIHFDDCHHLGILMNIFFHHFYIIFNRI